MCHSSPVRDTDGDPCVLPLVLLQAECQQRTDIPSSCESSLVHSIGPLRECPVLPLFTFSLIAP